MNKLRRIGSVVRKWANDKRNVGVVEQTNNQVLAFKLAHEWRHVCVMSKGMSIRREANSI
jgi:hypothetical protein